MSNQLVVRKGATEPVHAASERGLMGGVPAICLCGEVFLLWARISASRAARRKVCDGCLGVVRGEVAPSGRSVVGA